MLNLIRILKKKNILSNEDLIPRKLTDHKLYLAIFKIYVLN
jgi:hypothetical protein